MGDPAPRRLEEDGLLTLDDTEPMLSGPTIKLPYPRDVNPWRDETPTAILERKYQCQTQIFTTETLNSGYTQILIPHFNNTTGGGVAPPAKVALNKYTSTFRKIRWKFAKFEVQIMSVPQLFGAIYLTGMPLDARRGENVSQDYGLIGHGDGIWIDLASMNSASLIIPWISNSQWFDLRAPGLSNRLDCLNNMMSLKIICAGVRQVSSTIPKSVTVNIWCSLHGVELSGPINPVDLSTLEDDTADANNELDFFVDPEVPRAEAGAITSNDVDADGYDYEQFVRTDQNQNALTPDWDEDGLVLQSGLEQLFWDSTNKLASKVTENFVKEGVDFTTSAMKRGFNAADNWMGDWFSFDNGWDSAGAAATAQSPTQPAEEVVNVANNPVGSSISTPSVNALGRQSMLYAGIPDHTLKEWMAIPSFVALIDPAFGNPSDIECRPFDLDNGRTNQPSCDRMTFVSKFFRYWRGSFRYYFYIFASPFFISKLNFTLAWDRATPEVGNTLNETITVKGFTRHCIEIPYLYDNPYLPCEGTERVYRPTLSLQLLTPSKQAGDLTPSPMVIVYKAPCDDFVFYSQRDPRWTVQKVTPPPVGPGLLLDPIEMQSSLASLTSVAPTTNYRVNYSPLLCPPKEESTWESLIRRWDQGGGLFDYVDYERFVGTDATRVARMLTLPSLIDLVSALFMFWRGSRKFKFKTNSTNRLYIKADQHRAILYTDAAGVSTTPLYKRTTDGLYLIDNSLTQYVNFTAPFLCTTDWCEVFLTYQSLLGEQWIRDKFSVYSETGETPALQLHMSAAGDDFAFSYSLPPPCFSARAWNRAYSYTPPDP